MDSQFYSITKIVLLCVLSLLIKSGSLYAQNFLFTYNGPDTLYVSDDNCAGPYTITEEDVTIVSTINANVSFDFEYGDAGFDNGDFFHAGDIATMFVEAWDDEGNNQVFTFSVIFVDLIPPTFDAGSLPDNNLFYTALDDVPPPAEVTASDDCGPVMISYMQSGLIDTCAGGAFFRTWTAVDTAGNTAAYTQTLILNTDETPPQFTIFPVDGTSNCETYTESFADWLTQNMNTIQAEDNISIGSYSNNAPEEISFVCDTSFSVTFTATDICGLSISTTANFSVIDITAPVILNQPADTTFSCDNILPALRLNNGLIVQDCDQNTIETFNESSNKSNNPLSCAHYNYTIVRNWKIEDHCGNATIFQQTIAVADTTSPIFQNVFPTISTQCHQLPLFQDAEAIDNCAATVTIVKSQKIIAGSCTNNYSLIRTWIAIDVCGNESAISQTVEVFDTLSPIFMNVPNDTTINCGMNIDNIDIIAFDSCDTEVSVFMTETSTQNVNPNACDYYNYTIERNWLLSDNCGNGNEAKQIITIKDTSDPIIICPQNIVVVNDTLVCGKTILIPGPASYFDDCSASYLEEVISTTESIEHPSGQNANTFPVEVSLSLLTSNPVTGILGNVSLVIDLLSVDGEGPSEFFNVYSEDNTLIGQTTLTNSQCGTSTTEFDNISIQQLSAWMADGRLDLQLVSAGAGEEAINDICQNAQVKATLSYSYAVQYAPLQLQFAIDDGTWQTSFDSVFMDLGIHDVTYLVEDCSGNQGSCFFQIEVEDSEKPIVECPMDTTIYVAENTCIGDFILPFPLSISDNCSTNQLFNYTSDTTNLVFENNANAGWIPVPLIFNIQLASNAVTDGKIIIQFQGNNVETGAYFKVFGENNTYLGKTALGPSIGACTEPSETILQLTKTQINNWGADGLLVLKLIPESDASNFSSFIYPCENLNTNQIDESSFVHLALSFEKMDVNFTMIDSSGTLYPSVHTSLTRTLGFYPITYSYIDKAGLTGLCQWSVSILDTIAPVAIANNTFVEVNPSGTVTSSIDPNIVNNNSFDNCEIESMSLTPETFSCDQVGNTLPIILTVTDASGNIGRDTAYVQVMNEEPNPVFSQGVCGNDTLFLFANPPMGVYTYQWTGPNGFVSTVPNPSIANPSVANVGSYNVVIQGFTGCVASSAVQVQLNALPEAPILFANKNNICPKESIVLSTQGFAGSMVNYRWYDEGVLIETSPNNTMSVLSPTPGTHNYSVEVEVNGCTSVSSNIASVFVNSAVEIQVLQNQIDICAGNTVSLGVLNPSIGVNYQWIGPNQFLAMSSFTTIEALDSSQNGLYIISAEKNGCVFEPDTTILSVLALPVSPIVAGISPLCENDPLVLFVENYTQEENLYWTNPMEIHTVLQSATLSFSAEIVHDGQWSLVVDNGYCSTVPLDIEVVVNKNPVVEIEAPMYACLGETITLAFSATPAAVSQAWTGPELLSYQAAPTTIAQAGVYSVLVNTSAGCSNTQVITLDPIIPPMITALSNTSNGCFSGEVVQLLPTIFPQNSNYQYDWIGPNGFSLCCDNAEPIIENIDETMIGDYSLVVSDEFGCKSDIKTTNIQGVDKPETPVLTSLTIDVCQGEPISIELLNSVNYTNEDFEVHWLSPKGAIINESITYLIEKSSTLDEGLYSAIVLEAGCASDTSASVFITVNSRPDKPIASSNSPVCMGGDLMLSTLHVPQAQYFWNGEDFTSVMQNSLISNVNFSHIGGYTVQTSVDGCLSEKSDTIFVEIKELPLKPVLEFASPICMQGGVLNMNISSSTQIPGAKYTWIYNPNDTIVEASFFTLFQTMDLTPFHLGQNQFVAIVDNNGCVNSSAPITIQIDEQPSNQADAGLGFDACINQTITLNAVWPSVGSGSWTQVCGPLASISNPDANSTSITDVQANKQYCFVWSISSGGCENYSRDTVVVNVFSEEEAVAGDFIDTCVTESLNLKAKSPIFTFGTWSQALEQENTGIKIVEKNNPSSLVTGLKPGTIYTFLWTLGDVGCGESKDAVQVRVAKERPNAGEDESMCSTDDCIQLQASHPFGTDKGFWSSLDAEITFLNPDDVNATACGIVVGENAFVWTLNDGHCGDWSRDTVIIDFQPTPIALEDTFNLEYGTPIIVEVAQNDNFFTDYVVDIVQNPLYCQIEKIDEHGKIQIQPNVDYIGKDEFVYEICNEKCMSCTEATVFLNIGGYADCKITTIFTPNKDGINDFLVVPCLFTGSYINSSLSIINRWGDEIFYANNYKNDWDGSYRGSALQEGTYFYIFDLGDGTPVQKGFVEIKY